MALISYTEKHFKTEENYFTRFDYPETEKHVKAHAAFVQKVSDFKEGFEQGKFGLSIEVMNFSSDRLKNHIRGVDIEYSQFFNDNGLI